MEVAGANLSGATSAETAFAFARATPRFWLSDFDFGHTNNLSHPSLFSQLGRAATEFLSFQLTKGKFVMPSKLLDPTLDVTFKLLMTSNEALLLDMIGAVVQLPAPIDAIEVLNPEIPKTFPGDKTIRLDIRVTSLN